MKIEGKTFFVTGGASGLGEATVRYAHSKGANVVIVDMNKKKGEELAAELGDRAIFVKVNVTDEKSVQAAVDASVEKFGAIHACVNCAGIGYAQRTLSKSGKVHSTKAFQRTININLIGTFLVLSQCAKVMIANEPDENGERGVIVNTASIAAFDGQIGQAAYSASKAAVCGMTLPIARDLGKFGVRICTIAPGIFLTPMMTQMPKKNQDGLAAQCVFPKRLGDPSEFARLAAHIFENAYLNGEVIRLDACIRMHA
jgi:NAD(P)-dependent dehydrogenase (short-subunit alcohol dehydrogenase family)